MSTTKVPLGQKIAFGIGMFANQMFPAILGIFMVVLVENLGFEGWMWGFIFFAPRVFDSITDPIMGFISDNTKSKWGRRRPYVFLGGLVMGVAFIVMWQLYIENTLQYNFWYFFSWSLVFYLGLTIFSVPYVAMGYEMTDDFHERTNIMAIAQWIGQWAWVIAPWFWIIMYDPEWFPSAEVATRTLAVWVGIPCVVAALVPALFIKSKSTVDEDYEPLSLSNIGGSLMAIFQGFVEAAKIRSFRKLCISTFLIFGAFNTVAALTFFVIVYKLFNGDAAATGVWVVLFGCLGALGTTFIVIPVVAWMSKKLGKKKAFLVCQGISIVGYTMLYFLFVPGKPWLYIIALPFFSFGIGSLFTIMMSMTADILDIDELNSGLRREGIFGAIYWWMVKLGLAIAGALSGLVISLVGFEPGVATVDQQGAVDALHAFFCFFPALGTIAAMIVMSDYEITEERSNEIRAKLDARKTSRPSPDAHARLASRVASLGLSLDTYGLGRLSDDELAARFHEDLQAGMHGICFSPYLEGQQIGSILSRDQIDRRLRVVSPHTQWIRSFSCTDGNELIPELAKTHGKKTMVGAWIGADAQRNEIEINNLIDLAKRGLVDIAVVGNEVLHRNDQDVDGMLAIIQRVKSALPGIPVGYVDAYYQYVDHPQLMTACDVVLINCYPFWEGADIDHAGAYFRQMIDVTTKMAGGKPIIVTETGWPNQGDNIGDAYPSERNAMRYFVETMTWAKETSTPLFYFSSFDESWKVREEGDVGARWGLWDVNENLKY